MVVFMRRRQLAMAAAGVLAALALLLIVPGCQRGGGMVVPGAVVAPGLTRRLRRLSCRAPHNSPCTLMRTWLRQMGLTLRLVAAEYLPVRSLRR